MAVRVETERLIIGAAGLTVILRVAESLLVTFVAVTVYTILVAALAGVPEIVPSAVSKDRPLSIAGNIEYVASPPEFVTVISLMAVPAVAVRVDTERLIIGAAGLTVILRVADHFLVTFGAAGLTVILRVAESLLVTFVAVTVYTTLVAALAGVPEIVPSVVSKDKLLAIAGEIE